MTNATPRTRVGFLGPLGTFTEQALKTQPDLAAAEHVLYRTMPDVLDAVESGEVDLGFVAIENSIEGAVNLTQDELAFNHDLLIQREVVLDIEHCLMALPGTAVEEIKVVLSIPVASAQCHAFLRNTVGHADLKAANSTAEAARMVAEELGAGAAAVAPRAAARPAVGAPGGRRIVFVGAARRQSRPASGAPRRAPGTNPARAGTNWRGHCRTPFFRERNASRR